MWQIVLKVLCIQISKMLQDSYLQEFISQGFVFDVEDVVQNVVAKLIRGLATSREFSFIHFVGEEVLIITLWFFARKNLGLFLDIFEMDHGQIIS